MRLRKSALVTFLGLALVLATAGMVQAQPSKAARVSAHPDFDTHTPTSPAPGLKAVPQVSTVLQWDDGSYETGLGVNINAQYDGQIGMRFGGSPATTGLVPMRLRGAYWRMFGGFAGATNVNLNFWTNVNFVAGNPPGNLALQLAGNTNTTATQFVSTAAGPIVSTANGSVLLGVGVLGTSSWFVAGDNTAPNFQRQYFGAQTNNTTQMTYGPSTLSFYGFNWDFLVRLMVDGNVPVELESFSIE